MQVSLFCQINFIFYQTLYFPKFSGDNLNRNKVLYSQLAKLAAKHQCTPGQLALAWLQHQGSDVVPIPGILVSFQYIHLNCIIEAFSFMTFIKDHRITNYTSKVCSFDLEVPSLKLLNLFKCPIVSYLLLRQV